MSEKDPVPQPLEYSRGRGPRHRSHLGTVSCILGLIPWVMFPFLKGLEFNTDSEPDLRIRIFIGVIQVAIQLMFPGVILGCPVVGIVLGLRGLFVGKSGGWEVAWVGFLVSTISAIALAYIILHP